VWSASQTSRFTPRERTPGTQWIGGWVGPRSSLDAMIRRKIPGPYWNPPVIEAVKFHVHMNK